MQKGLRIVLEEISVICKPEREVPILPIISYCYLVFEINKPV